MACFPLTGINRKPYSMLWRNAAAPAQGHNGSAATKSPLRIRSCGLAENPPSTASTALAPKISTGM